MIVHVVGHGPSVLTVPAKVIDQHVTIRMKDEASYGRRCDWRCSSTETMLAMLQASPPRHGYWCLPKYGKWSNTVEGRFKNLAKRPYKICLDFFTEWNKVFLHLTNTECPNFSLGMFAILCAAEYLQARQVVLFGFDNMLNPSLREYHKADKGLWQSGHDWASENRMLNAVRRHYNCKIEGYCL